MFKRLFDIICSLIALIVLFPLFVVLAVLIKIDSKGPVIYTQTRLGKNAKSFKIYKFRTMVENAEDGEPQLAHRGDKRITSIGHTLRKYHLDELPQLWNVFKGDMSIVGPRPEREYFVEQIIEINPDYKKLFSVRPGLTSWGMVKYGYASDVRQMTDRMRYDLHYIKHYSMLYDLKVIAYTIKTVISGKGI